MKLYCLVVIIALTNLNVFAKEFESDQNHQLANIDNVVCDDFSGLIGDSCIMFLNLDDGSKKIAVMFDPVKFNSGLTELDLDVDSMIGKFAYFQDACSENLSNAAIISELKSYDPNYFYKVVIDQMPQECAFLSLEDDLSDS